MASFFAGNPEKQLHVAALLLFVLPVKSLTIKVVTVLPIFQTNHTFTPPSVLLFNLSIREEAFAHASPDPPNGERWFGSQFHSLTLRLRLLVGLSLGDG
jgi:hypothetical protein